MGDMKDSKDWSTKKTFGDFYSGFLNWDFTIPGHYAPPDHIFYFAVHAANNFGFQESFGVIDECKDILCKLRTENMTAPLTQVADLSWRWGAFLGIGCLVGTALLGTMCYVRMPEELHKKL